MKDKIIRKSRKKVASRAVVSYRMKVILPIVFGLQGATVLSPEDLLRDAAVLFSTRSPYKVLGTKVLRDLRNYLKVWGIKDFTK